MNYLKKWTASAVFVFCLLSAVLWSVSASALSDLPQPGTSNYSKNTRAVFDEWKTAIENNQQYSYGNGIPPDATSYINVTASPYNAVPNDGLDDITAFQAAVDQAAISGLPIYVPSGVWDLGATWNIPYNVSLLGQGPSNTIIQTMASGNYTGGFLIRCNRVANDTSWDVSYPKMQSYMRGIKLSNEVNEATVNHALYIADKRTVEDSRIEYFHKGVEFSAEYLDHKTLKRVKFSQMHSGTYYPINTGWLGDALSFDQIAVYFDPTTPAADRKVMYMKGAQGGSVTNSILNGEVYVTDTTNITFSNNHLELYYGQNGYIFDNASNIRVEDDYIQLGDDPTVPGIRIRRTGGSFNLADIVLDHVGFFRNSRDAGEFMTGPEISTSDVLLTLRDVYTTYSFGGANDTYTQGVSVFNNDTGLPIIDFNNRSSWLSKYCQIRDTTVVDYSPLTIIGGTGNPTSSILPITLSSKLDFTGASGTYYYKVQALYDIDRQLGADTEEESVAVVAGGDSPMLSINLSAGYNRITNMVFYRGSSTNSYTEKAIVPAIYTYIFRDGGSNINGIKWEARTAGPVDVVNTNMQSKIIAYKDNVIAYSDDPKAPLHGDWNAGDEIWQIASADEQVKKVICTASGSPGTWKTVISAPLINVDEYGAVGDGVTDDSVAIQAAFDRAAATGYAVTGTPGKTYAFNTPITITSADVGDRGFRFESFGTDISIDFVFGGTGFAFNFTGSGDESSAPFKNLNLEGLHISGDGTGIPAGGLYIDRAYLVRLSDITSTGWKNASAVAADVRNTFNTVIDKCQFSNDATVLGGSALRIGSVDSGAGDAWNSSNIKITNSIMQYANTGLNINHQANLLDALVIENNSFGKNSGYSIFYIPQTGSVVSNVDIEENHFESVGYNGTATPLTGYHLFLTGVSGLTVTNNNMKDATYHIYLTDVNGCAVSNNKIFESGVYTIATSTGLHIATSSSTSVVSISNNEIFTSQIDVPFDIDVSSHAYHVGAGVLEVDESVWNSYIYPNPAEYQGAIINRKDSTNAPNDIMFSPNGSNWYRLIVSAANGQIDLSDEMRVSNNTPAYKMDELDSSISASTWLANGVYQVSSLAAGYGTLSSTPFKIDISAPTDSWVFQSDSDFILTGGDIALVSGGITVADTARTTNGTIKWDGSDFWCRDNGVWVICGTPTAETADPCATYPERTLFYNDTSDYMCYCDSTTTAKQVHSPTTNCF